MNAIAVVTDSTSYLPSELVSELGVQVVPLHVKYADGREELESEVDIREYYVYLTSTAELPTTTPPTAEQFLSVYEPLLAAGRDVVSIHISSGLSQTPAIAREAVVRLGERGQRVHVIDSAAACAPLALLVLAAARKAASGADVVDVVNTVREARLRSNTWICLDTLEFLRRGGRIGGASAWVGTRLQIKPILTFESVLVPVERVRTRERAVQRLVEYGRRLHATGADAWAINHIGDDDETGRLAERLREVFLRPPEFITEVGPVVGTHTGPGLLGISGMPRRFLE